MDWRTTLPTSKNKPDQENSAEQRFREAFERLKLGVPKVLPKGTHVSQNNIAKEAGCDPSALRKTRFPLLVNEIQEWIEANKGESTPSKRQQLKKQRIKRRKAQETIDDLKKERDFSAGLLGDANLRIIELTEKVALLQTKLDEVRPTASVSPLKK